MLRIRDARPADAAAIADFNRRLALETEDRRLDAGTVELGVRALLDDPAKGRYWLAELDGRIAGQIMVTREWSDWRNGEFWWIQSVFVDASVRGRGVFAGLYANVERLAREAGNVCGLRLYVEHGNRRAIDVYRRLGMQEAGYRVMETEFETNGALSK